jgi:hypothetical protein
LVKIGSKIIIFFRQSISVTHSKEGMAKLWPAGCMRPFNFFLQPADFLLFIILPNRHLKASKNDKLEEKKCFKNFYFAEIAIIKSVRSNSVALNVN